MTKHLHPGSDYPHLNDRANAAVRVEVGTARSSSPGGSYVSLTVRDDASGETLASVQIDPAEFWDLLQGGSQTWPAFVSMHLDRVGKRMENHRVDLPDALIGDSEKDLRRDVWMAVNEQLPDDWHDGEWDAYDTPRVDNRRQRYTIVRRWRSQGEQIIGGHPVSATRLAALREESTTAWIAAEVAAGRACGDHERPLPCPECA